MKKCLAIVLGVGALLLTSADFVQAGGGGSKADPQVQIQNRAGARVAVLADATKWIADGANPANFQAYGGKVLNPNQLHTFKVKAGAIQVVAQLLDGAGAPVGAPDVQGYVVAEKALLRLKVVQAGGNAVLQPQ